MNRTIQTLGAFGIFFALCSPVAAADDTGWRLKLTGVAAQSTHGSDTSFGAGLGLEYRASRRIGVELATLTSEISDEVSFDFFGETVTIESTLRMTLVLAKLNLHLTPDHRADLYLGPVVGRMFYSDLDVEVHNFLGETITGQAKTEDDWAWGAHVGVDVPVGDRGLFFTAGATWLDAQVEIEGDPEDEESGDLRSDLDPLVAQIGFGYRF